MTKLAIIGSAGRRDDAAKLTLSVWNDMKRCVYAFVTKHGIKDVVSGGAAGADHLSVGLYNAGLIDTLTLALPCEFDWHTGVFADNGERHIHTNPAKTINHYHRRFSEVIGKSSLEEIKTAIHKGAEVIVEPRGFFARNTVIAQKADALIAFTFGRGARVKPGGTADTVRKYLARGGNASFTHVDLHTMTVYENDDV